MADKDQTPAERRVAELTAENERLRGQLAASGARTANVPAPKPYLTEGERQALITFGVVNDAHTGQRLNLASAAKAYPDVDLGDASPEALAASEQDEAQTTGRGSVRGVDYVWPSVQAGRIDPTVAGTPGISGPAA